MESFEQLDPYTLLGVKPDVDAATLRQAYLREIARYHPDRFANQPQAEKEYAARRAQRITEAYHELTRGQRSQPVVPPPRPTPQPQDIGSRYEQAVTLLRNGRPGEALPILQQIAKRDPQFRSVGALVAEAEAAVAGQGAPRRPAWVWGGAVALIALLGLGWSLRPHSTTVGQGPTASATTAVVVAVPASSATVPVPTASAVPSSLPSGGNAATVTAEATSIAATTAPATSVPVPTSAPTLEPTVEPTAEIAPTAVAPTVAVAPATAVAPLPPPTALPRVPTAVPQFPTAGAVAPRPALPAVEAGNVIISNDFSQPNGWISYSTPNYSIGARGGTYNITAARGIGPVFSLSGPVLQNDTVIGVSVLVRNGVAGVLFGPGQNYRFVIDGAGGYRVENTSGASIVQLLPAKRSAALRPGFNRLQVLAHGRQVAIFANNVLLGGFTMNSTLQGTAMGFVAIANPTAADAAFDNLTVRAAP